MINVRPTQKQIIASFLPCLINIYGATLHFYQNNTMKFLALQFVNQIAKFPVLRAKQSQMPGLCLGYWNYDMIVTRTKAF